MLLETPVSLITLVTDSRQFFVSSTGLPEPWASRRETPLSHSFCQHVVRRNQPLIVNDAKHHPLVYDNLAIDDLNVAAYLGVPLLKDNVVLGAFCVISDSPRNWTDADLAALTKLASSCSKELIQRKATMDSQMELENRLRQSQKMEAIGQLSAGVAHDFNNILWAIQIRSELLRHELIARGNSLEHVEQIDSAVDAAKGVVEQLLICGRPEDQPPTQV